MLCPTYIFSCRVKLYDSCFDLGCLFVSMSRLHPVSFEVHDLWSEEALLRMVRWGSFAATSAYALS